MKNTKIYLYLWRLFCVLVASVAIALFWRNTLLISILLLVLACLINIKSSKLEIFFYIIVAIVATLVESVAMSTGAWVYVNQDVLNFPFWLPLYWGMGGIVMKDLYLVITQSLKK